MGTELFAEPMKIDAKFPLATCGLCRQLYQYRHARGGGSSGKPRGLGCGRGSPAKEGCKPAPGRGREELGAPAVLRGLRAGRGEGQAASCSAPAMVPALLALLLLPPLPLLPGAGGHCPHRCACSQGALRCPPPPHGALPAPARA